MSSNINYERLSLLGDKVKGGGASKEEKDEFMWMLLQNGSITQQQYNEYINNGNKENTENILQAALAVGAVLIIGFLIGELFKKK